MSKNKASLKERILKNSTISETSLLNESKFFGPKDFITTSVPAINIALSGDVDGGLLPGVTMLAGPSRHFKTGFMLLMAKAFLSKYPEGVVLFYDSEFGSPQSYFEAHGIPLDSVIHTPITDIEMLKHDLMNQLNDLDSDDKVMICVDSLGNLASKKEIEDATNGDVKVDFTRSKSLKSLFRMITPHLTMKGIPFVCVNHSYKTIEIYSKDVVSGGTGAIYGAGDIWILGRQQDKDGKDLKGYNFIINVDKSRTIREKSKIPVTVSFERGIHQWSGLFDIAVELGLITSEKQGWYKSPLSDTARRRSDCEDSALFWNEMFEKTDLKRLIRNRYQLHSTDSPDMITGELPEEGSN